MASIFSKIISGEIPSYKVAESEAFYAFLDINPMAKGHTLVVPKEEVDYYFDLSNDTLSKMSVFCKDVAKAIEKVVECERVGVAVLGLEVPHAHVHLIPITTLEDLNFSRPKLKLSKSEFETIAENIQKELLK
ncbi:MAG: HIT family protein [Marinilabiliales bacterium]|nr:MAG: HIT family protein [Marinilabiliales bacterium]